VQCDVPVGGVVELAIGVGLVLEEQRHVLDVPLRHVLPRIRQRVRLPPHSCKKNAILKNKNNC
jgi:hypothetical protein